MKTKNQKIELIFEYEVKVDSKEAEFMEMSLDEMLEYRIESLIVYAEDRAGALNESVFKGINYVK